MPTRAAFKGHKPQPWLVFMPAQNRKISQFSKIYIIIIFSLGKLWQYWHLFNELSSSSHNSLRLEKTVVSVLPLGKPRLRVITSIANILTEAERQSQGSEPSSIAPQNVRVPVLWNSVLIFFSSSSLPQGKGAKSQGPNLEEGLPALISQSPSNCRLDDTSNWIALQHLKFNVSKMSGSSCHPSPASKTSFCFGILYLVFVLLRVLTVWTCSQLLEPVLWELGCPSHSVHTQDFPQALPSNAFFTPQP